MATSTNGVVQYLCLLCLTWPFSCGGIDEYWGSCSSPWFGKLDANGIFYSDQSFSINETHISKIFLGRSSRKNLWQSVQMAYMTTLQNGSIIEVKGHRFGRLSSEDHEPEGFYINVSMGEFVSRVLVPKKRSPDFWDNDIVFVTNFNRTVHSQLPGEGRTKTGITDSWRWGKDTPLRFISGQKVFGTGFQRMRARLTALRFHFYCAKAGFGCPKPYIRCKDNSSCYMLEQRCDGFSDCNDSTDEPADLPKCKCNKKWGRKWCVYTSSCIWQNRECKRPQVTCSRFSQFACADGTQCISIFKRCNFLGRTYCRDGSDQGPFCNKCRVKITAKVCKDLSNCYDDWQKCDGKKQCDDGEDERNCLRKPTNSMGDPSATDDPPRGRSKSKFKLDWRLVFLMIVVLPAGIGLRILCRRGCAAARESANAQGNNAATRDSSDNDEPFPYSNDRARRERARTRALNRQYSASHGDIYDAQQSRPDVARRSRDSEGFDNLLAPAPHSDDRSHSSGRGRARSNTGDFPPSYDLATSRTPLAPSAPTSTPYPLPSAPPTGAPGPEPPAYSLPPPPSYDTVSAQPWAYNVDGTQRPPGSSS